MKLNKFILPALVLCMSVVFLPVTAYAGGGDDEEQPPQTSASATVDPEQTPEPTPELKPFTPDGQATVVDNATDEDGKEFYTFVTPNDNVFYLVIDKQRENDNVYFLNAVTEDDLLMLAEKSEESESAIPEIPVCVCDTKCVAGEVDIACPVCINSMNQCIGKAADTIPPAEEAPKKQSSSGTLIFVLIAIAVVGGAGYYFKIYMPKKDLDDAEDFDEIVTGEDEPTINEDAEVINEDAQELLPYATEDDYPDDDYPDDEPVEPKE